MKRNLSIAGVLLSLGLVALYQPSGASGGGASSGISRWVPVMPLYWLPGSSLEALGCRVGVRCWELEDS
jgi:hypothetical protein